MVEFEYQHIVPRVYFKPWEIDSKHRKSKIVDIRTRYTRLTTTWREFGLNDFYTITIDNFYIFNDEDKIKAYSTLFNYSIMYDGKKLISLEDFHLNFPAFQCWIIEDCNGDQVDNQVVLDELKKVRILDLEKNWNKKVESKWDKTVKRIERCVKNKQAIDKNDYDFIYLFIAAQKIRMEKFKADYIAEPVNLILSSIFEIPEDPVEKMQIEFEKRRINDSIYKKILRDFQNDELNNKSVRAILSFVEGLSIVFCLSNGTSFNTSDNPIIDNVKTDVPSKYRGLIFPLTPSIIVIGYLGSKNDNQYLTQLLTNIEVDEINRIIINNSIEKYITL